MRLLPVALVALQFISSSHSFRDFPAEYTAPSFSEGSHGKSCTNCTVLDQSYKNLLTRRKRSFAFVANHLVVLTDVAASGLLSNYPRSIYFSMEIDLYYNVPTAVDGWRKPWDDWVKIMKAQKKAYEADKEEEKQEDKLQHVGTVNVSSIPLDEYSKLAYSRPTFSQFPWKYENSGKRVWNHNRRVFEVNRRPNYRVSNRDYYPNSYRRNYVQPMPTTYTTTPFPSTAKEAVKEAYEETDRSLHESKRSAREDTYYIPSSQRRNYDREAYYSANVQRRNYDREAYYSANSQRRNSDRETYYSPYAQRRNYVQLKPTTELPEYRTPKESVRQAYEETDRSLHEAKRSVMENPQKWHNHREYRERRALYDHIETFGRMLGVSLRKCIQRAICEMKEQLLPEGESLINDVARILFTVPVDHGENDEFTEMAREQNVDCARRFVVSCPHSPLRYFQTNFRASGQPTRPPTAEEAMQSIMYA